VEAACDVRAALRDLVRGDGGRGEELHQVGAGEILQRAGVSDLVHAAANEQEPSERASGRMLHHLVDLELVVARPGLKEEVMREVLDEVTRGEDVVARSGPIVGVLNKCGRAACDELLGVTRVLHLLERARLTGLALTGSCQHGVDRGGDELDVAELLGGDAGEEVVEGTGTLAVTDVKDW
jgi:hypothetical protein